MNPTELVALARAIAEEAHAGQFRRNGKTPYILHPMKVAALVCGDNAGEQVAWLHDVLEDNHAFTDQILLNRGVPSAVVDAVLALTHSRFESYPDYLNRAVRNPLARKVKIADIVANLSDAPTPLQIVKYNAALQQLCG